MRVCDVTGKKIGFLEKVYVLEDGRRVSREGLAELNKKEEDVTVELRDSPNAHHHDSMQNHDNEYVELTPKSKEKGWEFRVIKLSVDPAEARKGAVTIERFENTINKMGEDGWELCTVVPLNVLLMNSGTNHAQPALIFKKPRMS